MDAATLHEVLDHTRLPGGAHWSMPVLLTPPGPENLAVIEKLSPGDEAALLDDSGRFFALLHVGSKFTYDKGELAQKNVRDDRPSAPQRGGPAGGGADGALRQDRPSSPTGPSDGKGTR